MFPNHEDRIVNRIERLHEVANGLVEQQKKVKWNKVLKGGYSIAIAQTLDAINRLSVELTQKEPTDGNQ